MNDAREQQLSKTFAFSEQSAIVTNVERLRQLIICVPNGKSPVTAKEQPQHMKVEEVEQKIFIGKYNVGIALNTHMLDVDFDTYNPTIIKIWDYFLPRTPYRIGRKSKPDSHWLYNLTEEYHEVMLTYKHIVDTLARDFKVDGKQVKIEYRHRSMKHNNFSSSLPPENPYVFAPGSLHTSGELVTWDKDYNVERTLSNFDVHHIMKKTALAMICAMIVPHWNEGSRQYLSMALAGALYRMANVRSPEEEEERLISFDLSDFEELYRGICEFADDKEEGSRLQTLRQTWHKSSDPDIKTTGNHTLGLFLGNEGSYITDKIFRLLTGASSSINVQELSERFYIIDGVAKIADTAKMNSRVVWTMPRQAFSDTFASHSVLWQGKRVKMAKFCFEYGLLSHVDGLDYCLPEKIDLKLYTDIRPVEIVRNKYGQFINLWKPYDIAPSTEPVSDKDVKPFLDYVKAVFGTDIDAHAYLLNYLANIIQTPGLKPRTYPIIVGVGGAGKSFLFEHFIGPILGTEQFTTHDSIDAVLSSWNGDLRGKVLCLFEEALHSNRAEVSNKLKQFVTGTRVRVRQKYEREVEVEHVTRPVFLSNNEDNAVALDATIGERRAYVIRVSDRFVGNETYFEELKAWANENLDKVHRWLLDFPLDNRLLQKARASEAKATMQKHNALHTMPELFWLLERIEDGFPLDTKRPRDWFEAYHTDEFDHLSDGLAVDNATWPNRINKQSLRNDLREWAKSRGIGNYKLGSINQRLDTLFPNMKHEGQIKVDVIKNGTTTSHQPAIYAFPSQQEILDHLRPKFGHLFPDSLKELTEQPVIDVSMAAKVARNEI